MLPLSCCFRRKTAPGWLVFRSPACSDKSLTAQPGWHSQAATVS